MRDFPTQVGPGGEPVADTQSLTSSNANDIIKEIQGAVTDTGQALINLAVSADNTQLSTAVSRYAAAGTFYTGGGTGNAQTLTTIGSYKGTGAYQDGQEVRWMASNANTAAVTIDADSIGVVDLTKEGGAPLVSDAIDTTVMNVARYNASAGRFELIGKNSSLVAYDQGGTGSVETTVESKLQESVSVFDFMTAAEKADVKAGTASVDVTTAVQAAVADANTNGMVLHWPDGVCLTTASIVNLHDVKHVGPGAIKRGSDTFYLEIKDGQTNTLYAATAGSAANDGLTSSQPNTIQGALDDLANYGPILAGKWLVKLAAGTYTTTDHTLPIGLQSRKFISIQGPDVGSHPNVPTAIIDGTGGATQDGFVFRLNTSVEVKDIKITDMGSTAIQSVEGSKLSCRNVHQENCFNGITAQGNCELWVSGGLHKYVSSFVGFSLIRSMFGNKHTIGYYYDDSIGQAIQDGSGSDITQAPQITNTTVNSRGIHLQENTTGHVYAYIDGFSKGIELIASSRANIETSRIWNCSVGIEVEHHCEVGDGGADFGVGTANRNSSAAIKYFGGVEKLLNYPNSMLEHKVGDWTVGAVHTGTTGETQIGGILYTIPDYALYRSGSIRMRIVGVITGTAGNKLMRMRLGGSAVASVTFVAGAQTGFIVDLEMKAIDASSQITYGQGIAGDVGGTAGVADATVLTTSVGLGDGTAQDVTFHLTLGNAADSIDVKYIEVYRKG